jgi:hypothetical protein
MHDIAEFAANASARAWKASAASTVCVGKLAEMRVVQRQHAMGHVHAAAAAPDFEPSGRTGPGAKRAHVIAGPSPSKT